MDLTQYTPSILSLCTGYGGVEKALSRVFGAINVLAHVEIEAFAIANLVSKMESRLLAPAPIYTDIKTLNYGIFRGRVDILTAGFPCQPFSNAGKRLGSEDPRHLWPFIEKGIDAARPRGVFLENVEGIISTKTLLHRPELQKYCRGAAERLGATWGAKIHNHLCKYAGISVLQYVLWRLEQRGYKTTWGLFSAGEVGGRHKRKRVFILAYDIGGKLREQSRGGGRAGREDALQLAELGHKGAFNRLGNTGRGELHRLSSSRRGKIRAAWLSGFKLSYTVYRPRFTRGELPGREERSNTGRRSAGPRLAHGLGAGLERHTGDGAGLERHTGDGAGSVEPRREFTQEDRSTCPCGVRPTLYVSRPGEPQHCWEEPRTIGGDVADATCQLHDRGRYSRAPRWDELTNESPRAIKSQLGGAINGAPCRLDAAIPGVFKRVDRLRLCGNGVVPDEAELAFITLHAKLMEA